MKLLTIPRQKARPAPKVPAPPRNPPRRAVSEDTAPPRSKRQHPRWKGWGRRGLLTV